MQLHLKMFRFHFTGGGVDKDFGLMTSWKSHTRRRRGGTTEMFARRELALQGATRVELRGGDFVNLRATDFRYNIGIF